MKEKIKILIITLFFIISGGYTSLLINSYYLIKKNEFIKINREDLISRLVFLSNTTGKLFFPTILLIIFIIKFFLKKKVKDLIYVFIGVFIFAILFYSNIIGNLVFDSYISVILSLLSIIISVVFYIKLVNNLKADS
jgi:hypothetical protein